MTGSVSGGQKDRRDCGSCPVNAKGAYFSKEAADMEPSQMAVPLTEGREEVQGLMIHSVLRQS